MQFGGVLSTSQVAKSFIGTGFPPCCWGTPVILGHIKWGGCKKYWDGCFPVNIEKQVGKVPNKHRSTGGHSYHGNTVTNSNSSINS